MVHVLYHNFHLVVMSLVTMATLNRRTTDLSILIFFQVSNSGVDVMVGVPHSPFRARLTLGSLISLFSSPLVQLTLHITREGHGSMINESISHLPMN